MTIHNAPFSNFWLNQPQAHQNRFPEELYRVKYEAPGSPELARKVANLVKTTKITLDKEWGLDHGTWSVLVHMFPKAEIPVVQLSLDYYLPL